MKGDVLALVVQFRTVELYALQLTPLHEALQVTIVISIVSSINEHIISNTLNTWYTQQLLV